MGNMRMPVFTAVLCNQQDCTEECNGRQSNIVPPPHGKGTNWYFTGSLRRLIKSKWWSESTSSHVLIGAWTQMHRHTYPRLQRAPTTCNFIRTLQARHYQHGYGIVSAKEIDSRRYWYLIWSLPTKGQRSAAGQGPWFFTRSLGPHGE